MTNILIFGELVSSNNFFLLLSRSFSIINNFIGLGIYMQGLPVPNATDFVWGTNAGLRTLPILIFLTFLQKIQFGFWSDALLILSLFLSFFTFLIACSILRKTTLFTVIGAIFFGGNVWILNRIYTGFWQLNIAYAVLPFLVIIPIKIINLKNNSKKEFLSWSCLYVLFSTIVLISQPHFLIMIGLFSFFHLVLVLKKKQFMELKQLLLFYFLILLIFLCVNSYFLIPSIFYSEINFTAPSQYFSLAAVIFNGKGDLIEHILRFDPLGFSNQQFVWTWFEYLQLLPILCFVILFYNNKKRNYLFFFLALIFLFLAKGLNQPAPELSRWIYQNIFFMHFFRDPTRFLGGVSLFISLSVSEFKIKKKLNISTQRLIIFLTILFFILINSKLLQPTKTELLIKTTIPDSYLNTQQYINNNLSGDANNRLLILPNQHGMAGYPWYRNKSPISANTVFDAVLPLNLPLVDSTNYPDMPSSQVSAFLYREFSLTYNSNLLKPLGVKYILVDSSISKPDSEREIASISRDKLVSNKSYQLVYQNGPLSLFKVNGQTSIVNTEDPIFAIGNLETVAKNYVSGSDSPIVLLNQFPNPQRLYASNYALSGKNIYFDMNNPNIVLTAEELSNSYSVDILKSGWDYDKTFVNYEPYKMEYISQSGELFTSGRSVASRIKGKMIIPDKLERGKYHLLLKSLTEDKSSLKIIVSDVSKKINVNTNKKLIWIDCGVIDLKGKTNSVTVAKTDTNLVVIDQLLIVPEKIYKNELAKTTKMLKKMTTLTKLTASKDSAIKSIITTDKITISDPVKYLTYRLSFGDYWKSNINSEKFISDGYGMTFVSNDKKISEIDYFPNIIYLISIFISILCTLTMIIYVVLYNVKSVSAKNLKKI